MKIMGLVVYNFAWAETHLFTKWHLDPSSRMATIDMGRKVEGLLCPLSDNVAWAEAYLCTKWHLDPSSRFPQDVGRKVGVCCSPPFSVWSWLPI